MEENKDNNTNNLEEMSSNAEPAVEFGTFCDLEKNLFYLIINGKFSFVFRAQDFCFFVAENESLFNRSVQLRYIRAMMEEFLGINNKKSKVRSKPLPKDSLEVVMAAEEFLREIQKKKDAK